MATIGNIINKVQAFNTDVAIQKTFQKTSETFTEENKKQLLYGYNRDGEKIGEIYDGALGYKRADYAYKKYEQNNKPGLGNPDLYKTGAFFEGISTSVAGEALHIESSDEKAPKLESKYPRIYGLGGRFRLEFIAVALRPNFLLTFHEATGI